MIYVFLAFGLTADAFAVGLALGCDRIRVSGGAKCLVALLGAGGAAAALWAGYSLGGLVPPAAANLAGGALLLSLGLWMLLEAWLHRCADRGRPLRLRGLGLSLCVLRDPAAGDIDQNRRIDPAEGFTLALALSLDVIGACLGLGASRSAPALLAPGLGLCQLGMLWLGLCVGGRRSEAPRREGDFFPGGVLVAVALVRLASAMA